MRLIFYILYFFVLKIVKRQTLGMYIKNVCEKMGVVYIKLAQILSTRSDIIKSEQSRADLSKINDSCNVLGFLEIEKVLKEEYGKKLYDIFKYIDKEPLGAASVSQVHSAILVTGEEVAVKVKRQDILKNVDKDIKDIKRVLRFLCIFSSAVRFLLKSKVLDIYLKWIKQETDFNNEKKNIKEMYEYHILLNKISILKNNKKILLVKLYEELCSDNIIVMEYIKFPTINKMELEEENARLMKVSINSYLQRYFYALFNFNYASFHGDPHSGNIFIDKTGNIGFIDFGLVFKFEKWQLDVVKEMCIAMYKGDFDKLYKIVLKLSGKYGFLYKERKKEERLKSDLKKYLVRIEDLNVTNWFMEMAFLFLRNKLVPPEYFFEFGKAFLALDGIILFSINNTDAYELLYDQFSLYYKKEKIEEFITTLLEGSKSLKPLIEMILKDLSS